MPTDQPDDPYQYLHLPENYFTLSDPDPSWLLRWRALRNTIQATIDMLTRDKFNQLFADDDQTIELFKRLLCKLLAFSGKQFLYFFFGFSHDLLEVLEETNPGDGIDKWGDRKPEGEYIKEALIEAGYIADGQADRWKRRPQKLAKDYDFPPDYVLRATFDQITFDFEVIQRALHQRLLGTENTKYSIAGNLLSGEGGQKAALKAADKWSADQLNKISSRGSRKGLLSRLPAVISYFNRSSFIRVIPYAHVALIGIPMTTTEPEFNLDLLVNGHELGHFVYWHGYINDLPVRESVANILRGEEPYLKNWAEEVFADVFGVVISEVPEILIWALIMVNDNATNYYVQDSGEHPIDAIRPYIYIDTIFVAAEGKNKKNKNENTKLVVKEEREQALFTGVIEDYLDEKHRLAGGHQSFQAIDRHGNVIAVSFTDARDALKRIIQLMLSQIIRPVYDNSATWRDRKQTIKDSMRDNVKKLFTDKSPQYFSRKELYKLLMNSNSPYTFNRRFESEINGNDDSPIDIDVDEPFFAKLRDRRFESQRAMEPAVWKIVFAADGWTIKGPETRPVGSWEQDTSEIDTYHL